MNIRIERVFSGWNLEFALSADQLAIGAASLSVFGLSAACSDSLSLNSQARFNAHPFVRFGIFQISRPDPAPRVPRAAFRRAPPCLTAPRLFMHSLLNPPPLLYSSLCLTRQTVRSWKSKNSQNQK